MTPALTQVQSGYFSSFDKTQIYYEVRGQGEPLVLVYGIACLINHFHFQIEELSKTYQVICFDLRGHHRSEIPRDPKNLSLSALAQDIAYLLRNLGHKKAHFIGHSFGVPAMLAAFERSPSLFQSLTLINGFAKNPIKGMFGLDVVEPLSRWIHSQFRQNPILWNSLWRAGVDNPLSTWISVLAGGFNINVTQYKDIEIYARGVSQIPLEVFLPFFEEMMTFDGSPTIEKIDRPVLIVSGDKDLVTPQKFQRELHEKIKGSEYVSIPYGSHCCQLDFPDYVNLKIKDFLSVSHF